MCCKYSVVWIRIKVVLLILWGMCVYVSRSLKLCDLTCICFSLAIILTGNEVRSQDSQVFLENPQCYCLFKCNSIISMANQPEKYEAPNTTGSTRSICVDLCRLDLEEAANTTKLLPGSERTCYRWYPEPLDSVS